MERWKRKFDLEIVRKIESLCGGETSLTFQGKGWGVKKAKERKKGFAVIRKPAEDERPEETFVWMFDNHEATAVNLCLKSLAFRRDPDLNWGPEENAALAHAYADFLKRVGVWSP